MKRQTAKKNKIARRESGNRQAWYCSGSGESP